MIRAAFVLALGVTLIPATAAAEGPWEYLDPGDLISGSGQGNVELNVFAPGMRFPMEDGPAFANSQVYMAGGSEGGGGGQCDAGNYDYPWRDNYCETRSWDMPLCPAGAGHQGQDIRPGTCDKNVHWISASAAGTVTNVGSYSVYVTAPDGTRYDYLHGEQLVISSGDAVDRGDRIGRVSNNMGGTATTIHLHFNLKQDVAGVGFVYVSPYMSLVEAYEELMGFADAGTPDGALETSDCTAIRGWAQDPDVPEDPVTVGVWFDGEAGDPDALGLSLVADEHRADLCASLGSCEHGFSMEVPRIMRDDAWHAVRVFADDDGGGSTELEASPSSIQCAPPPIPDGVRRLVASPEVMSAWAFSPVWDMARVADDVVTAIEVGEELPGSPELVRAEGAVELWLLDNGLRRRVSEAAAEAWRLDPSTAAVWPADDLLAITEGTPLRDAPFLVTGSGPDIFVIDDLQCSVDDPACDPGEGTGGGDPGGTGGSSGEDPGGDGTGDGLPLPPGFGDADGEEDGCACGTGPRPGGRALLLLLLLPAGRRRGERA